MSSGQVQLVFWDGTAPRPAAVRSFRARELSGIVQLQIERIGDEFVISANEVEVGRMKDPGAFPEYQAYLGANVAPNNELTIHKLSVEAAAGQEDSVQVVNPADLVLYTPSDTPLRDLAQARDVRIGAAVSPHPLRCERAYPEVLGHEFNFVTTEKAMKFGPIHPQRERYAFQDADEIVDFCQAHDMVVRGHTLVWHNQLPRWVKEGEWTREELMTVLREHITTVVGRYRGRVAVWDVVNEAVADDGSLRDTIWLRVIGPDYLDMAFRWAHEADPDALLFYNDYNGEGLNVKSDAIYDLVQNLLARDVPVHGVGLQMHVSTQWSPKPQDVLKNMDRLADLGLEVHITEMDVRIKGQPTEKKLARQAAIYRDMMETCLSAQRCTAYVLWGFTDRHSWVPGFFAGWGHGLIFDEDYRPKPAYEALRDALAER
jgi:endo-1,4-beta-xylanase